MANCQLLQEKRYKVIGIVAVKLEKRWLGKITVVEIVDLAVGFEERGSGRTWGEKETLCLSDMTISEE